MLSQCLKNLKQITWGVLLKASTMQGSKWLLWVTEHWSKAMRFTDVDTVYLQEDSFATDVLYKISSWSCWCEYVQCYTCVDPGSLVGLLMCVKLLVCLHVQGSGHWRDLIIKRWNGGIFVILCYTVKNHKSALVTGFLFSQNTISKKTQQNRRQHCSVAIYALHILCRRLLRLPLISQEGCV